MYDNGCVNRLEKEKYPPEYVISITAAVENMLALNPRKSGE